jgi:predicted dehydrogenase
MPNGLGFDLYGTAGRASFDFHRPAEYLFDDAQPEARTRGLRRVICGPQMPYFAGGYPMEAPGVGIGNQEGFNYQARAFLDQISGVADPLPPNASFADGLRSMQIIAAVVQSAQSDGAAVKVGPPPESEAVVGAAALPAPPT